MNHNQWFQTKTIDSWTVTRSTFRAYETTITLLTQLMKWNGAHWIKAMSSLGGSGVWGGASTSSWISTTSVSASGKRIQREVAELNLDPPPDCSAGPKSDSLYNWVSTIIGPTGLFSLLTSSFFNHYWFSLVVWSCKIRLSHFRLGTLFDHFIVMGC